MSRVWIRLAFGVKYRGGRLIHVIEPTQCDVFLDCRIERAALYQRADLGHLGRREHSRYGAIHVAGLFPPFLVLKQHLLDSLKLANLCPGAAVLRRHLGMRVHG
jgi:hypothetical protein